MVLQSIIVYYNQSFPSISSTLKTPWIISLSNLIPSVSSFVQLNFTMGYKNLLLLIFLIYLQKSESTCPAGAIQSIADSNVCYSFYSVQLSFTDAEQTCTDLRGHLASINNGFINTFLTGLIFKIM